MVAGNNEINISKLPATHRVLPGSHASHSHYRLHVSLSFARFHHVCPPYNDTSVPAGDDGGCRPTRCLRIGPSCSLLSFSFTAYFPTSMWGSMYVTSCLDTARLRMSYSSPDSPFSLKSIFTVLPPPLRSSFPSPPFHVHHHNFPLYILHPFS